MPPTLIHQKVFIQDVDGSNRVYQDLVDGVSPNVFSGLAVGVEKRYGVEYLFDDNILPLASIPSIRSIGAPNVFNTTTARTVALPAYVAGDIGLLLYSNSGSQVPLDLSNLYGAGDGWTLIQSGGGGATSSYRRPTCYARRMLGTEGSSVPAPQTFSTGSKMWQTFIVKDAFPTGLPVQAIGTGTGASSTAISKSGGVLNQGKNLVLVFESDAQTQATGENLSVPFANADLTNIAMVQNFNDATLPISLKVFKGEKDTAATIGATTATLTALFNHSEIAIAIWGN